jgi:hypothetical protein
MVFIVGGCHRVRVPKYPGLHTDTDERHNLHFDGDILHLDVSDSNHDHRHSRDSVYTYVFVDGHNIYVAR